MIAYKAFNKGLKCRGYQFQMGLNVTEKAQTKNCGFHCAENPLDCLDYYHYMDDTEFYIVNAGGDVDEDDIDSKISCTELTIIQQLNKEEFVLHALAYMVDHAKRECNKRVAHDKGTADYNGFVIVRGADPVASGKKGDILAFAREVEDGSITEVAMVTVDGQTIKPGKWYGVELTERQVPEDD